MLTYKKLIEDYLKYSSDDSMRLLAYKTSEFVEKVREYNSSLVDEFLTHIDLMLNPHFTKETAEYAVSKMKNRDGSTGQKWSYDETTKVLNSRGYKFDPADWFYVLNKTYSDEWEQGKSSDEYIKSACMFLDDIDAPKNKAKRYFLAMCE